MIGDRDDKVNTSCHVLHRVAMLGLENRRHVRRLCEYPRDAAVHRQRAEEIMS